MPYAAPGDRLLIKIERLKKNHGEGKILKILSPSPQRTEVPCPIFGECGGCKFQHISYEEQLKQKNSYIHGALRNLKVGRINPIIPSPKPFNYRNRIQIHIQGDRFGYLKSKSNDLVPVSQSGCLISEPAIHEFLQSKGALGKLKSQNSKKVEIFLDQDERLQVRAPGDRRELAQFSQVNRFQNQNLIQLVVEWARTSINEASVSPSVLFDFFAGSGNLTFPLYEELKLPIEAVELSRISVAQASQSRFHHSQIKFYAQSVDEFLRENSLKWEQRSSLVISDPPREGLGSATVDRIAKLKPFSIVHVGCDLMNFARDLRLFSEAGYQIKEIQPLDMFPQTDHVEIIARLMC